jgi:hypothetical protein
MKTSTSTVSERLIPGLDEHDLSPAAPPSWPDLFRPSQGEGSAFVRTRRRHNMFSGPAARIGVDGRDKHGHDGRGL